MNTQEEKKAAQVSVPVEWLSSNDLPSLYINNLYITHPFGDEFYLIFGDYQIPMDARPGFVPDKLQIKPVVKLVINPSAMKEIIDVITKNYEKYLESHPGAASGEAKDDCS